MSVDGCDDDQSDRRQIEGKDTEGASALRSKSTVLGHASFHADKEVVRVIDGPSADDERLLQLLLEAHLAPSVVWSMSPSSERMARVRCVFTEFREIISVDAISSMPSSS